MRNIITVIGLILCIACQPEEIQKENLEIVSDCNDVIVENVESIDFPIGDTVVIPEIISDYEIDDYYSFFFGTSVNDIKDNTPKDAFEKGSFVLNTLDYNKGFISLRTQNTPLDMDGDTETEEGYEITYWIQSDTSRIIAFCKSQYSYVDEASDLTFFLHDRNGINKIEPEYANWTLNDFVDKDVSSLFSEDLINNPPVYISLPLKGKTIQIYLALGEYYEPMEVYEKFDSLGLTINSLILSPVKKKLEKVKAW